jgi:serine protease Do
MQRLLKDSYCETSTGKVSGLLAAITVAIALFPAAINPLIPTYAHAEVVKPQGGPASFSPVVKAVAPAVVHIEVTQRAKNGTDQTPENLPPGMKEFFERFFGNRQPFGQQGPQSPRTGLGSGFFIDADGHIVTNNHVISGASEINVTMKDGSKLEAKLIGADTRTDLALLKVDRDQPFPFVSWGDSDKAEVGDWIVAVGNPFGLDHTVTTGIISARGRSIGAGPYDDFLQIDAPINKGNSGGPAFGLDGRVLGVNTAIFSPTGGSVGIGFAIPANLARDVIAQLKVGGSVKRGWLGVAIQTVSQDIAEGVGLKEAKGAIVSAVTAGGPAAAAGLKVGDVILEVDDTKIDEMAVLPRVIAAISPNKIARLKIWRDNKARIVEVKLGSLPDENTLASGAQSDVTNDSVLGLTLEPLDAESRRAAGIDKKTGGVLIADINQDSPLTKKGVEPGSVLLAVAGTSVSNPTVAADLIREAKKTGRSAVLLLIRQNGSDRFVAAPFTPDK